MPPDYASLHPGYVRGSMQRRALEVLVDLLEMIEALDRPVERVARVHVFDLLLLRRNALGEYTAVEVLDRVGKIGEHRQLSVRRNLREAAEHDHALLIAVDEHRHDPGAQRRHGRRVSGKHAEIAFRSGYIDLIDFAGEQKLFGRDEIEVESAHARLPHALITSDNCNSVPQNGQYLTGFENHPVEFCIGTRATFSMRMPSSTLNMEFFPEYIA